MKLYQIIMTVPDDFNPEEVELRAHSKMPIKIATEGFVGPFKMIECAPDAEIPTDLEEVLKGEKTEATVNPDGTIDTEVKVEDVEEPAEEVKEEAE